MAGTVRGSARSPLGVAHREVAGERVRQTELGGDRRAGQRRSEHPDRSHGASDGIGTIPANGCDAGNSPRSNANSSASWRLTSASSPRRSAAAVTGSVPGARPSPRSIRPGWSASSVRNTSTTWSGAWLGTMIPPGAQADARRDRGGGGDEDLRRRRRDVGHVVMLGEPVPDIAERIGGARELDRVADRLARRDAGAHRGQIEDGQRQLHGGSLPRRGVRVERRAVRARIFQRQRGARPPVVSFAADVAHGYRAVKYSPYEFWHLSAIDWSSGQNFHRMYVSRR